MAKPKPITTIAPSLDRLAEGLGYLILRTTHGQLLVHHSDISTIEGDGPAYTLRTRSGGVYTLSPTADNQPSELLDRIASLKE